MERQEEKEQIGVNELKNLLMDFAGKAFRESFDKGEIKYGDRWKTTGWTGIKGLADSKWDMFLNLLDGDDPTQIVHHASDIIGWVTILSVRALHDIRHEDKTIEFHWDDFKHCDEIQDDCFLVAIDEAGDKGFKVTAKIPKIIPEGILDYLLNSDRPKDLKVVIE